MYRNRNERRDRQYKGKTNQYTHVYVSKQSSNDDNNDDDDDELLFTYVLVGVAQQAAVVAKGMLLKSTEAYNQF